MECHLSKHVIAFWKIICTKINLSKKINTDTMFTLHERYLGFPKKCLGYCEKETMKSRINEFSNENFDIF